MQLRLHQRQSAVRQSDLDARLARPDRATPAKCSPGSTTSRSGVFVKGVVGLGTINGGHIDDRDFFVDAVQVFRHHERRQERQPDATRMFDIGWAYSPLPDMRLGFFVGYHYWREKVTAYGIVLQSRPFDPRLLSGRQRPGQASTSPVAALRADLACGAPRRRGQVSITDRWSVSGEIAVVPYAALQNKDSHLLRQSFGRSRSRAQRHHQEQLCATASRPKLFVNYAVTPNIEIGAGVRYWGRRARTWATSASGRPSTPAIP